MRVSCGQAEIGCDVTTPAPGRDVLLIHAGVTDRRSWHQVVSRLAARHRCVSYDARGYGDTTYAAEERWSAVSDACAVLDAAGAERVCVVGSSLGGQTAIDLALAHPDRVAGLALIAPGIRGAPETPADPGTNRIDELIEAAESAGDDLEVNRLEAWLWLDGAAAEHRVHGAPRELFLEMNGRALAAADPGPSADLPSAWGRLDQITVPVLVIIGSLDTLRMRTIAADLVSRVAGARLCGVDGVAHLPHLEGDTETLDELVAFVDSVDD